MLRALERLSPYLRTMYGNGFRFRIGGSTKESLSRVHIRRQNLLSRKSRLYKAL
jgi:hypothetical protein